MTKKDELVSRSPGAVYASQGRAVWRLRPSLLNIYGCAPGTWPSPSAVSVPCLAPGGVGARDGIARFLSLLFAAKLATAVTSLGLQPNIVRTGLSDNTSMLSHLCRVYNGETKKIITIALICWPACALLWTDSSHRFSSIIFVGSATSLRMLGR